MNTYVVRVWLTDAPGMLGQITTHVGAFGADVVGIEILERDGGQAIDELLVSLPVTASIDELLRSLAQLPGVGVEEARLVAADRPDPSVAALNLAAHLAELDADKCLDGFVHELVEMYEAEWATVIDLEHSVPLVEVGLPPDAAWLAAFAAGSAHLDAGGGASMPSTIAWSSLDGVGAIVAVGRQSPFRARERQQIAGLARVASALLGRPTARPLDGSQPVAVGTVGR